jgi:hypothetical protein
MIESHPIFITTTNPSTKIIFNKVAGYHQRDSFNTSLEYGQFSNSTFYSAPSVAAAPIYNPPELARVIYHAPDRPELKYVSPNKV